jgi:hypothetical protein
MAPPPIPRRVAVLAASAGVLLPMQQSSAVVVPPLSPRLDAKSLSPLSGFGVSSRAGELRYPSWLAGSWRVSNTIEQFTMPLGPALVDAFTRAVAEDDVDEAQTLQYTLRFMRVPPPGKADEDEDEKEEEGAIGEFPVAQDRAFNAAQETDAFLGPDGGSVRGCQYEVTPLHPHGRLVLDVLDPPDEDGKRSSVSSRVELTFEWVQWGVADSGAFVTSELVRQRTTRPPTAFAPALDDTSYLEILTSFARAPPPAPRSRRRLAPTKRGIEGGGDGGRESVVRVRNRLVQYLELPRSAAGSTSSSTPRVRSRPNEVAASGRDAEARAMLAGGRAVSFFDYNWKMERIDAGIPSRATGRGSAVHGGSTVDENEIERRGSADDPDKESASAGPGGGGSSSSTSTRSFTLNAETVAL